LKKWHTIVLSAMLAAALIAVLGWLLVVPGEVKTLVRFARWHDGHLRTSGYVDRQPPGTRIARADVVGWSDGGNIGLDLARRYPDRIRKLVAFGANHTPPPDGQDSEMTREFKEAKADAGMFMPLRYLYQKDSPTPDKWSEFFERERAMLFAGPNWSLADLSAIHAQVLLLNGEHDLVLLPYATAMKNAITGARLEIVAGEGHELPLANPAKANPIMLSFLRQ
jgi:pimeloyl-ACP methyl ester carboxylesterase